MDIEENQFNLMSVSRNATEILELCIQPKTEKEMENILLSFMKKLNDYKSESENFSELDVACMYALYYTYEHNSASFSTVFTSLFIYQKQIELKERNQKFILNWEDKSTLKELQHLTNLDNYSKCEEMLDDISLSCILNGDLGLALYLLKFGLMQFPSEVNKKYRKMFGELLKRLDTYCDLIENKQTDLRSIQLDEQLYQIKEENINFRRSLLIFCFIVIVAEYISYDKLQILSVSFKKHAKAVYFRKLTCLNLYIEENMEPRITTEDIEIFIGTFLNPHVKEVGKSLIYFTKNLFGNEYYYHNPRSLKDHARFKIRSCFRNSMIILEQINELEIPVVLKDFLNFHSEGIWEWLVLYHTNICLKLEFNSLALQTRNLYLENESPQKSVAKNLDSLVAKNVHYLEARNIDFSDD